MTKRARRLILILVTSLGLAIPGLTVLTATSALAAVCNQTTHVWFADTVNGQGIMSTLPGGTVQARSNDRMYTAGVVEPGTTITLSYQNVYGGPFISEPATPHAAANCVVNQTYWTAPVGPVTVNVFMTYTPSETDIQVNDQFLGRIQIS
jgi:hypothetical protein